jgi:predicted permease
MNRLLARLRSYARQLRGRDRIYAEMDEEMRFHIDMEAQRLQREDGLDPAEARRRASVAFGGVEKYREAGHEARGLAWLGGASLDVRLGVRMLRKHPGLALVGVLGMAVAIAVAAGVFSLVRTMTDPAIPLHEGERIVKVFNLDLSTDDGSSETHLHDLQAWRTDVRAVEDFGAYRIVDRNLIAPGGAAEPLPVAEMSASGFRVGRVPPLLGRPLVEEDERPGAPPVVVVGETVWRNRFAADPAIIGRVLRLGAEVYTVVGVMPDRFRFPINNRVWTALRLNASDFRRGEAPEVEVFGRLAPGATLQQAQAEAEVVGRRLAAASPETHRTLRTQVQPYARAGFDNPGGVYAIYLVQLLTALLLVVIAVNMAVLVYARTATRTGEIAVRLALGASRGRVVAQLFAEAMVLAALAAVLGLGGAALAIRELNALMARDSGNLPFWWRAELSTATVLYATGLALLAAGIVGVVPALKATGRTMQSSLRELGGGTGMRMGRTWTALIVVQVAVAVALLPGVGALAWRDIVPARAVQAPVPAHELLVAAVGMDRDTPPAAQAAAYEAAFQARLRDRQAEVLRRLRSEPGVREVSFASALPDAARQRVVEVAPRAGSAPAPQQRVSVLEMDPALFAVFDVPLLAGRPLHAAQANAAVVNRSFVERVLGGRGALGTRFRYPLATGRRGPGGAAPGEWYEIVGVVSDFGAEPGGAGYGEPVLYHPVTPGALNPAVVVARVQGTPPTRLADRLREITLAVDPSLRLSDVGSLAEKQRQERRVRRTFLLMAGVVAVSVLLFSAAGIHALMSFTVARRRKEVAIRTALGAHPRRVLGAVFARSLGQLSAGVAVGAVLATGLLAASGLSLGRSAALLTAIATLIFAVGLLAAAGPARRALRIQPMEALRED